MEEVRAERDARRTAEQNSASYVKDFKSLKEQVRDATDEKVCTCKVYVHYVMSHLMAHCMYLLQRKAVSQLESTETSHRSTVDRLAQLQKENQELQAQLLGEKRKYEESLDSVERELDSVKDRLSEKTDLLVCSNAVCSEIACLCGLCRTHIHTHTRAHARIHILYLCVCSGCFREPFGRSQETV